MIEVLVWAFAAWYAFSVFRYAYTFYRCTEGDFGGDTELARVFAEFAREMWGLPNWLVCTLLAVTLPLTPFIPLAKAAERLLKSKK